jgi:hypothetical protein
MASMLLCSALSHWPGDCHVTHGLVEILPRHIRQVSFRLSYGVSIFLQLLCCAVWKLRDVKHRAQYLESVLVRFIRCYVYGGGGPA